MNDFSKAKIGQRVYCLLWGYGAIVDATHCDSHPILVKFCKGVGDFKESYTVDGFLTDAHFSPTLYWNKPEIITPLAPVPTKLIHGVEVPDISFIPSTGDEFYYPDIASYMFVSSGKVDALALSEHLVEFNMCYPYTEKGREAATLHAKAMLGVSP
jgi:hypothetical protein